MWVNGLILVKKIAQKNYYVKFLSDRLIFTFNR